MDYKYLVMQNNKPICLSSSNNMMIRIRNLSVKQYSSYEDYLIFHINNIGELHTPFTLSIGFRETGYKYFLNQKMIEEKKLEELFSYDFSI